MGTLLFVLFWVVAGLGLIFVALSGGPRGARERLHTQTRRGRKVSFVAFGIALIALGIVIPGLVIAGVRDRDAIPEAGVVSLTEQEERGRELFAEQCNQCHTLTASAGAATVGPDLDTLRPTYGLVLDAIRNGRARGNGAMAADLVVGEDAEAVAAFVAKAVGQQESIGEAPAAGDAAAAEGAGGEAVGDEGATGAAEGEAGAGGEGEGGDAGTGE